jgi:hypothetical protein
MLAAVAASGNEERVTMVVSDAVPSVARLKMTARGDSEKVKYLPSSTTPMISTGGPPR